MDPDTIMEKMPLTVTFPTDSQRQHMTILGGV